MAGLNKTRLIPYKMIHFLYSLEKLQVQFTSWLSPYNYVHFCKVYVGFVSAGSSKYNGGSPERQRIKSYQEKENISFSPINTGSQLNKGMKTMVVSSKICFCDED